jgi:hypothetical protein
MIDEPLVFPVSTSSRLNKSVAGKVTEGNVLMHSACMTSGRFKLMARFVVSNAVLTIPFPSRSRNNLLEYYTKAFALSPSGCASISLPKDEYMLSNSRLPTSCIFAL